jgi:hypothetical protein
MFTGALLSHVMWLSEALTMYVLSLHSLFAGGAIYMESDVTLAGGAQFTSNWASPEGEYGSGGAVYVGGNSTLTIGGPVIFKDNSASQGGAVTLGAYAWGQVSKQSIRFLNSKSTSCWIGNYASTLNGGAALRIEALGSASFGTLASHNFGSNLAGPPSLAKEQDIAVLAKASFKCSSTYAAGIYSIEGNVCAASCVPGKSGCKCAAAQVFLPSRCSCQQKV